MVDPIQATGHKQSNYDRLTGEWRCDGARLGSPCNNGPDAKGRCPYVSTGKRHPCQPEKNASGYHCKRSSELGGPCQQGPGDSGECGICLPACRPLMGYRRQRRLWFIRMMALAIAFLGIVLGATQVQSWMQDDSAISPQHRFTSGCETCHTLTGDQFSQWVVSGAYNLLSHPSAETYPCTQCHEFSGPPMQAHNLDALQIAKLQQRINPDLGPKPSQQIACHQCHKEHKTPANLDADLDNQQCQSCHQKTFTSFDKSHPEFTRFPEPKQQRPLFDHSKHFSRFRQSKYQSTRPADCASCHMTNQTGTMVMPLFENTCSNCHLVKDILNVGGNKTSAVSWLTVPRIDASQLSIGLWPNCKTSGSKSIKSLSPITLSLLNADPETQAAVLLLRNKKTRFDKIKTASDDEREALTLLAWSFKQLLHDLNSGKDIRWAHQNANLSKQQKTVIAKSTAINSDMLALFTQQFFTDIADTVGKNIRNTEGQCIDRSAVKRLKKQWSKTKTNTLQGWYIQFNAKTMELGYRTQQHKDAVQQTLMNQYWHDPITFSWLNDKKKSINCQKCHSKNSTGNAWVWKQEPTSFSTLFSHMPHLTLGLDCNDCHQLTEAEQVKETEAKYIQEETIELSDFRRMDKNQCQECHHAEGRSDQCSSCHQYHSETILHTRNFESWDAMVKEGPSKP